MEEKNQNINKINNEKIENVSGGFAGKDKYSFSEYSEAGVSHEHNIWSKDQYAYKGKKISQKEATQITDAYFIKKKYD